MKNIAIDFTAQTVVQDYCLGRIGEHNATTITFTPPVLLSGDSRTDHYRIAFATGGASILSEAATEIPFSLPLSAQLTACPRMSMQIIAYAEDGTYIGKSEKVSGFYFESSVHGTAVDPDGENHDIAYELQRLKRSLPTKTSDLENDGEDGEPFITEGDIPEALPNPHKLTVNGTEYDGSEEVTLEISGGGATEIHIGTDEPIDQELLWYNPDEEEEDPEDVASKQYVDSAVEDKQDKGKATVNNTEYELSRHTLTVTDGSTTTSYNFLTAEVIENGD